MPKLNQKPTAAADKGSKKRDGGSSKLKSIADQPILYKDLDVQLLVGDDALTVEQMKTLLGWTVTKEDDYNFLDINGNRIRCTKNRRNRPFTRETALDYGHTVLNRHWADRRNTPEGTKEGLERTINGETIVIGRHGNVESGQHRLIGWIFADQLLNKDDVEEQEHWRSKWGDRPLTVECIIVYGVDESQETLRTIDNVRPRSLGDIAYTQDWFAGYNAEKREAMSKMLDPAVRTLWERALDDTAAFHPRRTNIEMIAFAERHFKLVQCIKHIYEERKGVGQIHPCGTAAALLYLMAACNSDSAKYRDNGGSPSEKTLDWSAWDAACDFWALAGNQKSKVGVPIREAISESIRLAGIDEKVPGVVKTAVAINAWIKVDAAKAFTALDIIAKSVLNEDGEARFINLPSIGGIDLGGTDDEVEDGDEPDEEEVVKVEKAKAEASAKKNGDVDEVKADEKAAASAIKELDELRKLYPDTKLLFVGLTGVTAYGDDADQISKVLRTRILQPNQQRKVAVTSFFNKDLEENLAKLIKAGIHPAILRQVAGVWTQGTNGGPDVKASPKGNGAEPLDMREPRQSVKPHPRATARTTRVRKRPQRPVKPRRKGPGNNFLIRPIMLVQRLIGAILPLSRATSARRARLGDEYEDQGRRPHPASGYGGRGG